MGFCLGVGFWEDLLKGGVVYFLPIPLVTLPKTNMDTQNDGL